jgi:hypothetical protein
MPSDTARGWIGDGRSQCGHTIAGRVQRAALLASRKMMRVNYSTDGCGDTDRPTSVEPCGIGGTHLTSNPIVTASCEPSQAKAVRELQS